LTITVLNNGLILKHISVYIYSMINGLALITAIAITMDREKIPIIK